MKVLAINSNSSNLNCKKENVNFKAVRVIGSEAITRFKDIAPAQSLTQYLIYYAIKGSMGKKIEAVVRTITGLADNVPINKVYQTNTGSYADVRGMKSDVFLLSDHVKRDAELDRLEEQAQKAIKEASDELTNRPDLIPEEQLEGLDPIKRCERVAQLQKETIINYFDELLDTEGTECWKLGQMIKGFVTDADKEGHQITNDEIVPFVRQLEANKQAQVKAIQQANTTKREADKAVLDEITTRWFTPEPPAEVSSAVES